LANIAFLVAGMDRAPVPKCLDAELRDGLQHGFALERRRKDVVCRGQEAKLLFKFDLFVDVGKRSEPAREMTFGIEHWYGARDEPAVFSLRSK